MRQQISRLLFTSFVFFLFTGCPESGVNPPNKPEFTLSADEIVSTEALIKIQYASSESITVQLKRNGQLLTNLKMYKEFIFNDTLVQPKQNYTYTAYKIDNSKATDSTSPLQITTMDTTSHDFTWETFIFGNGSSSVINDVAIINDTLIYAVGEIYILDSTGQNEIYYNAIKWDGKKWTLLQILVKDFGTGTGFYPLYAVYAFGTNDVWFASDADLIQWNGTSFTSKAFFMVSVPFNGQVRKMWGASNSNLYCVGLGGAIYHYNGSTWQKIESGTKLNIQDIWGVTNQSNKISEIFCAATSNTIELQGTKLLKILSTNKVDSLRWNSPWFNYSVWTATGKTLYLCGGRVLKYRNGNIKETDFGVFMARIRGNAHNDVMVVGDFGFISHYNGSNWRAYPELYRSNTAYRSLDVKGNTVVAIGFRNNGAVITIGKRIK